MSRHRAQSPTLLPPVHSGPQSISTVNPTESPVGWQPQVRRTWGWIPQNTLLRANRLATPAIPKASFHCALRLPPVASASQASLVSSRPEVRRGRTAAERSPPACPITPEPTRRAQIGFVWHSWFHEPLGHGSRDLPGLPEGAKLALFEFRSPPFRACFEPPFPGLPSSGHIGFV